MSGHPILLLTNDDGIQAKGLECLAGSLGALGDVWITAPNRERSATSHSLTLRSPIQVDRLDGRTVETPGVACRFVKLLGKQGWGPQTPDPGGGW